jgi:hypothetical protein
MDWALMDWALVVPGALGPLLAIAGDIWRMVSNAP